MTAGSLPSGLDLDSATGEITGTPASPGLAQFTVEVSSVGLTDSKTFQLDPRDPSGLDR